MNNLVELKKEELMEIEGGNFLLGAQVALWFVGTTNGVQYANFVISQMTAESSGDRLGAGTTTHR